MNCKPIIIVAGEPNSIFFEIFIKVISKNIFKSPIILIASKNLLQKQIKFFNSKIKIHELDYSKKKLKLKKLHKVNLINVDYNQSKLFEKISNKSNKYIGNCFDIALEILNKKISDKLINGPISKKYFLKKKFIGITEYLAKKTSSKKIAMIIYNKSLFSTLIT